MCTAASAGVRSAAASGYFIPPGATKADQSVVACSEGTEITANGKKYKDVTNCKVCTPPELNPENTAKPAVCTTCEEGYFGASCQQCNDQNCAVCSDGTADHCTKCMTTSQKPYLKKEGETDAGICVDITGCTTGALYYTDDTDTTESGKTCKKCSEGVTTCEQCTSPGSSGGSPACTKCSGDNYLKTVDGTTMCVAKDACKDGFFPKEDSSNGNKCLSCGDAANGVPNCAKCTLPSGATKPTCSECGFGYKLEGGKCTSSSTNRSGLSTGAIAGISVAAVIVGRGLVGLLCWRSACCVTKQTLVEAGSLRCTIWT